MAPDGNELWPIRYADLRLNFFRGKVKKPTDRTLVTIIWDQSPHSPEESKNIGMALGDRGRHSKSSGHGGPLLPDTC